MKIELDLITAFVAGYLTWATKARSYATLYPTISYRGHACKDWKLLPTLCRNNVPGWHIKKCEAEIITEFRGRYNLGDWTDIDVLAYARHHGAPTRLLDWTRNPLIALWFAISEQRHDVQDGVVYQLVAQSSHVLCMATGLDLEHADKCKFDVHIFASPHRIERTERQRSIFTIARMDLNNPQKPLDVILPNSPPSALRSFPIPSQNKAMLRRLLAQLGLDPYSIYGDPDSFGKSLTTLFDLSGLDIPPIEKWPGDPNAPNTEPPSDNS
jgi:hypothetical protein